MGRGFILMKTFRPGRRENIRKRRMRGGVIEYRKGYINLHPPLTGPSAGRELYANDSSG